MSALNLDLEGLSSLREGRSFQETLTTSNQGAKESMIDAVDRKLPSCFKSLSNSFLFDSIDLYYCQLMFDITTGKYLLKIKGKVGDRGTGATLMKLLGK